MSSLRRDSLTTPSGLIELQWFAMSKFVTRTRTAGTPVLIPLGSTLHYTPRAPPMNGAYFVASGALAGPPAVIATMFASLILVGVRALARTVGLTLTRRVSLYVDGALVVLFVLFLVFVIIRFKSLA